MASVKKILVVISSTCNMILQKEGCIMSWAKRTLFVGSLMFIFCFTGCYTVVMIPKQVVRRVETEDVVLEEEPYEDVSEEYSGDVPAVDDVYMYGDLWPGYSHFDPYWSSPYWWHYSWWSRWYWRPFMFYDPWDPWSYWYYGYGSYWYSPYYWGYGGYWDWYYGGYGYHDGRGQRKQPYSERGSFDIRRKRADSEGSRSYSGGMQVSKVRDGSEGSGDVDSKAKAAEKGTASGGGAVVRRKTGGSSDASAQKTTGGSISVRRKSTSGIRQPVRSSGSRGGAVQRRSSSGSYTSSDRGGSSGSTSQSGTSVSRSSSGSSGSKSSSGGSRVTKTK